MSEKQRKTPRWGHGDIDMERIEEDAEFMKAGQYKWHMDEMRRRSIIIAMPMSKDAKKFSEVEWTIGYKNHCNAQWSWNGDKAKPTLHPSLHWVGVWHGWVRNGKLVEA